ncbi:antitoxin [Nonomuraea sediminis]|uniref:antitoxin n=1 Tax=Nonomuraea sediminis TaxID=2835864 RepID=UPI001BDC3CB1|nr:antitoxin [Nonomuraea sediminis]
MSIFDKVKEMFGGTAEKLKDIPEQGGMKDKAEGAAMGGIDQTSDAAKQATGGKYDEQIDQGTEKAKDIADKIDGEEG